MFLVYVITETLFSTANSWLFTIETSGILMQPEEKKTKLRGRSQQANYTDRATAARQQRTCQPLRVEGVVWSAQRIPTAVNLATFTFK
jgi:hypothetical protein